MFLHVGYRGKVDNYSAHYERLYGNLLDTATIIKNPIAVTLIFKRTMGSRTRGIINVVGAGNSKSSNI